MYERVLGVAGERVDRPHSYCCVYEKMGGSLTVMCGTVGRPVTLVSTKGCLRHLLLCVGRWIDQLLSCQRQGVWVTYCCGWEGG